MDIFFDNEMLSDGFGRYSAVTMRIGVTKTAGKLPSKEFKFNLLNDLDCTTFFHEYTHHLQNISTVIGLQHFDLLLSMWHNTRNYMESNSDIESFDLSKNALIKSFEYNDNNKSVINKNIPIIINEIDGFQEIVTLLSKGVALGNNAYAPVKIKCTQDVNIIDVQFGIHEFKESSSHIMERIFCGKIKQPVDEYNSSIVPYKIAFSLKDYFFPRCTDENLLVILLTALNHSIPHKAFIYLIYTLGFKNNRDCQCESECTCGSQSDIRNECENYARKLIEVNGQWVQSCKNKINNGFSVDDPFFGNFIKEICDDIINMMKMRVEKPFIEIDFLNSINESNFRDKLDDFIAENGGCAYYIEDDINAPNKKFSFNIIGGEKSVLNKIKAWQIFQSAMDYTRRHYSGKELDNLMILRPELKFKCPLQRECKHQCNKFGDSDFICCPDMRPIARGGEDNCAYQLAVFKTELKNYRDFEC